MKYTAEDLKFVKVRDVAEVDQIGFVDLPDAYANNSVPTVVGDDDLVYNNIADPNASMPFPKDIFDVHQQNKTVHDYTPPTEENKSE